MSVREVVVCAWIVALPLVVLAGESVEEVEAVGSGLEPGTGSAAVTVFDRDDIETSGASTVPDLLRLVPGMDVATATPFYQSVSSRLPWTDEGSRFLVLVDGREANLEFLGLVPWGILPLSLDDVERIEVVRGSVSSLHGAGALAGVIHITTRVRPEGPSGWVGLCGGELNSLGGCARASFTAGPARVSFFGAGAVMGSFADPQVEGSRTMKLSAAADFPLSGTGRLFFEGGYSEGSGDFFTGDAPYEGGRIMMGFVRAGYESDQILGQITFNLTPLELRTISDPAALEYAGIRLANLSMPESMDADAHSLLLEFAWKAPDLLENLRFILGGQVRMFWLDMYCSKCLNPETFADITHPNYHVPGVSVGTSEHRLGTFAGVEFALADWLTAFGGVRFDFDSRTDPFASVRFAVAVRPVAGQFVRLGLGRSYRRTAYLETAGQLNLMAEFPQDSPITGVSRVSFQEFLSRVERRRRMGNDDLLSFEAGYLGRFFEGRLSVGVEGYLGLYRWNRWVGESNIVVGPMGLPDLNHSSFRYLTRTQDVEVLGVEVSLRFEPVESVSLQAWWTHREMLDDPGANEPDVISSPADMFALGGRYLSSFGLLGSVYAFYRTGFSRRMEASQGMMEPLYIVPVEMGEEIVVMGRLGWRLEPWAGFDLEAGVKVLLPVSPSASPHDRCREAMGNWNQYGQQFTGEELARVVLGYVQGTF